jgi:hypothetical protein
VSEGECVEVCGGSSGSGGGGSGDDQKKEEYDIIEGECIRRMSSMTARKNGEKIGMRMRKLQVVSSEEIQLEIYFDTIIDPDTLSVMGWNNSTSVSSHYYLPNDNSISSGDSSSSLSSSSSNSGNSSNSTSSST